MALLITGTLAGILGALLGLGGGIFLVPALTILFHLPIRTAVGASLLGVIATSAGVAAMARKGRGADVHLALRLEAASAAGAIAGGWAAGLTNPFVLSLLFAAVAFLSAVYLFLKGKSRAQSPTPERLFTRSYKPRRWLAGLSIASLAGAVSGLLGVGGGFIKVPAMYAVMGVPLGVATATSNFMVGITAAASVFIYYGRGDIHPEVVVPTALGVFLGAMLGVYVLIRLRVSWLRTALVGLLVLLSIQMVLHAFRN
ncbi:MAG: sulfite exporter TauE/SafE family protein [Acidobacteriota bacterium]